MKEESQIKGVGEDCVDHGCEKRKALCSVAAALILDRGGVCVFVHVHIRYIGVHNIFQHRKIFFYRGILRTKLLYFAFQS